MVNPVIEKKRDIYLDAVKGFLILCIILEHNTLLTSNQDWIRPYSDAFAAGCFLIFSFSWSLKEIPIKNFFDRYFSYWWTFIIFVTVTTILNYIMFPNVSISKALINYSEAIFFASPMDIKISSGFMYLWFLPCLSFLYLLRLVAFKVGNWAYIPSITAWLCIGLVDERDLVDFPFSLHVLAFIFFIGQIYSKIFPVLLQKKLYVRVPLIITFICFSIMSYFVGWELFLAGGNIPTITEPGLILFYSIFMLTAIPGIYHTAHFLPKIFVNVLAYLGNNSLMMYLFHPLVYILITQIVPIVTHPTLSFLATILICMLISYSMKKFVLINQIIFPSKLSALVIKRNF